MFRISNRPSIDRNRSFEGLVLSLVLLCFLWPNAPAGAEASSDDHDVKQELKLVDEEEEQKELSWLNQKILRSRMYNTVNAGGARTVRLNVLPSPPNVS